MSNFIARKVTTNSEGADLLSGGDIVVTPAAFTDRTVYIATAPCVVTAVSAVYATAETTAATLRVQLTKDTGTDAPGAGTDLLTNTSGAGFDLKATANTVQAGVLVAEATRTLAAGDRLGLDFTAAATELAGLVVTISIRKI